MNHATNNKLLSKIAIDDAAKLMGVPRDTLLAVAHVESGGRGFFADGQPKILFEAHVFSRLTGGRYDAEHRNLSSPTWNRALYIGGPKEHIRLAEAVKLDRDAALSSASWGMFQIMGFNWKRCRFASLQDFINAMYESEDAQFMAFCNYIATVGLLDELQRGDLTAFALQYNGPRQAENGYDIKLHAALASSAKLYEALA